MFKDIFIPYAPGDGGGSIGSALYFQKKIKKNINFTNLESPFLGDNFTNDEIKYEIEKNNILKKFKIIFYENKAELLKKISELIYKNKVIGFFNEKMEFGARALGNRSIIANPCNKDMKSIINEKIKRRESFRPFAPAVLEENKKDWFKDNKRNPYMSSVEEIIENKRSLIPAVTHTDGTGRVQTVSKDLNKDFYEIIENFYKISNVPIVLNTSFNENEPIVMSPANAINCFLRTNMDVLILNSYLISRD